MEPVHAKEALSHLDTVHLFAIQNEGDKSLQHKNGGIINITERITFRSKKQFFFSSLSAFDNIFTLYWSLEFKRWKCCYSKYSLFPHPFRQKMSTYFDKAKKKVKRLKIENFAHLSKKRTPPKSGKFWPGP